MHIKKRVFFGIICYFLLNPIWGQSVCFTPFENCTKAIVKAIASAQHSIYLQAYELTSPDIIYTLIQAKKRNVQVKIILDKCQWMHHHYSDARSLINFGIPIWIDYQTKKALNNVIIIDKHQLITSHVNFFSADSKEIAAHVLVLDDQKIIHQFLNNWKLRRKLSKPIYLDLGGLQNLKKGPNRLSTNPISLLKLYIQYRN